MYRNTKKEYICIQWMRVLTKRILTIPLLFVNMKFASKGYCKIQHNLSRIAIDRENIFIQKRINDFKKDVDIK